MFQLLWLTFRRLLSSKRIFSDGDGRVACSLSTNPIEGVILFFSNTAFIKIVFPQSVHFKIHFTKENH